MRNQDVLLPEVVNNNISDSLVAKELWQRKQTSSSGGYALGLSSFTAIIPWHPLNNYNKAPPPQATLLGSWAL